MTTRARLALQAERPTYDLNRHETYAMVTTDDARKLLALVEAVEAHLTYDVDLSRRGLLTAFRALTTDPEASDG